MRSAMLGTATNDSDPVLSAIEQSGFVAERVLVIGKTNSLWREQFAKAVRYVEIDSSSANEALVFPSLDFDLVILALNLSDVQPKNHFYFAADVDRVLSYNGIVAVYDAIKSQNKPNGMYFASYLLLNPNYILVQSNRGPVVENNARRGVILITKNQTGVLPSDQFFN